ncbi:MAG: hypothetical protein IKY44_05895 [Clostridia bacterium]|nr:hypothetical protein [Clostridia bacterium]
MSSTNKTPNLGLNSWEGPDKPKRADFNYDNEVIDTILGSHLADDVRHITDEEREKFTEPYCIESYIGDGHSQRSFRLDFAPSFVIVYAHLTPLATYDKTNDQVYAFAGIGSMLYCSAGVYLEGDKLTITDSVGVPTLSNFYPRLNTSGYRYQYIAFR